MFLVHSRPHLTHLIPQRTMMIFIALARAVEAIALVKLIAYIRGARLVYGISIDYTILDALGRFAVVMSLVSYWLPTVQSEYHLRYPLDTGGSVSPLILAIESVEMYLSFAVAFYVFRLRKTWHIWQYVSLTCISWLAFWLITMFYLFYCWVRGRATINTLDVVDIIRLGGNVCIAMRFYPQVTTNFYTDVFKGFPRRWYALQVVATVLLTAVFTPHVFVANIPNQGATIVTAVLMVFLGVEKMAYRSGSGLPK